MKKYGYIILLALLVLGGFSINEKNAFAYTSDCSGTLVGTVLDESCTTQGTFDTQIQAPEGSIQIFASYPAGGGSFYRYENGSISPYTASTSLTIVGVTWLYDDAEETPNIICTGDGLTNALVPVSSPANSAFFQGSYAWQGYFHCDNADDMLLSSPGVVGVVAYVLPYDTRTNNNIPMTDTHFTFIAGFFIFLSSFTFVVWLFKRKI